VRHHWRELDYWRWLWRQRMPGAAKLAIGVLLLAAVLAGGWFAADSLTAASASNQADSLILETTVNKVVTVHEKGKLVTKVVPTVKRVVRVRAKTETQIQTAHETDLRYATRVVTTPGGVRLVRRVVTTRVPVVTTKTVKQNGKTRTVKVTTLVPTTKTETQVRTETQRQTVTNVQTQAPNTVTAVSTQNRTTTQTQTQTQTQTVTTTQTVTQVQTQTVTNTQTVTDTQTVTNTVTVTEPAVTVTVSVPSV
jgi:hypothetical protein